MDNWQPLEARTEYLNGMAVEDKAAILDRASRIGPGPQDADWLVAKAADDAAKRIEAAVSLLRSEASAHADDRAAIQAALVKLDRLDKKVSRTAEPSLLPVRIVLAVSFVLAALFTVAAVFAPWPWPAIPGAFALGTVGGLGQPWIGPVLADWRWKLGLG